MKTKLFPVILSGLVMLSACGKENTAPAESMTEAVAEETDNVPAETETDNAPVVTEAEEASEEEIGNNIYTIVTDADGNEKVLYFMPGDESEPAFIYMGSDVSDPEGMMGYVSVLSENIPSEKRDMFFGKDLENMLSASQFNNSYISYYVSEGAYKFCSVAAESDEFAEMCRLIAAAEPEFIPVPHAEDEGEEISIEDSEGFYDYYKRYPVADLVLRSGRGSMSSIMMISFGRYNDRLAVKYHIENYSELDKLAKNNLATEEELRDAYGSSFSAESEWFYADSIEGADGLYDILLKTIIMSEKNELDNVRQYRTEQETAEGFTGDIAEFLYTDRRALSGYSEYIFKDDISFMLPEGEEPKTVGDSIMMWDTGDVQLMISTDSEFERNVLKDYEDTAEYSGKFGNKYCSLISRYDAAADKRTDALCIHGRKHYYTVKITAKGRERTEEYDAMCRSIFGSFRLLPEEIPESAEDIYGTAAPISLSDEPSRFTDEGYSLAEAVDYVRYNSAVPKYQAYVPRVISGGFYSLDLRNEYETKFDCLLEKLADDGNWYEVLPVNETYEINGDKWFDMPDVFDEARQVFSLDLSVYPPLPEGRYRVVKPIRRKDDPDEEYGAFMEFDMVHTGEKLDISAVCTTDSFPTAPNSIDVKITSDFMFAEGENYDIEYFDGEKWSSVRKKPIPINSVGGSYSMDLVEITEDSKEYLTEDFDLSRIGKYRLRIAVSDVSSSFSDNYAPVYAEFSVGAYAV
ncbi:MAG: hypothetical protein ACI4J0_00105 [Huintestinicola sp.]|uniref:hypothetical protein n=1 Tax=Huintestinicola sp. TaxID=2981661 RepID=UPI003EFF5622